MMSWFMEQVRKFKEHNVRKKPAFNKDLFDDLMSAGLTVNQINNALRGLPPHPMDGRCTLDGFLNIIDKTEDMIGSVTKEQKLRVIAFMRTYYKMHIENEEKVGLCKIKDELFKHNWISDVENGWLQMFMKENSPSGHVGTYWWSVHETDPRFEWLENMHAKIKNEIDIISMIESVINRCQSIHAGCMPNFLVMHPDKARELVGHPHAQYNSSTSIDSNESSISYRGIPIIRSFDVLPNQIMHL